MSSEHEATSASFSSLGLPDHLIQVITQLGYITPTPIQEEMIPHMLNGRNVVGQAQTGTGKTAAFALPILAQLKTTGGQHPQVLVLAPTRELAIQVAESFADYSKHLKQINILPIFGGQDYNIQLRQLQKGCQIIVGTPGRVMDHIRRGSLKMDHIHSLVLDEADEMLRMGFLDDVEWILEKLPNRKQTALFSATMPANIRKIAHKYLKDPVEITIKSEAMTANTVAQRGLVTSGGFAAKVDALAKVLESETFDGVLIFVRTKLQTVELAEKISALGYSTTALNGDIQQTQRLRTIEQLKSGNIDILIATDVAARGLDVERISHVINFDIPFDTEAYVHRIGRTGRAGRTGHAILFVNPRERSMLRSIERATKQKIEMMQLPTVADINTKRIQAFKNKISTTLEENTSFYEKLIGDYITETDADITQVAAALALLAQGKKPLLLAEEKRAKYQPEKDRNIAPNRAKQTRKVRTHNVQLPPDEGLERFRIEAGNQHGIKAGNIVGAIANEADINSKYIGRISIFDDYSTVDLPFGMPDKTLNLLKKARIGSRQMQIQRLEDRTADLGTDLAQSKYKKKTAKPGAPKAKRSVSRAQNTAV
ncbi:DEAD/DEAH box helicase [Desulforhopalus sp. IMCC35007]|uniref:DEAD/DEAH box helicase n=1 Tax=Desulforhopalus sp. IMCC35007 TaxID=2569543 RepID=UPI0010AED79A|nr:DEAD/DEAH box helicase [Desulforhopalus sp. IMCC35007]TKB06938.1 DEAD/DEAH box helicase [Desulforhopalus sp. IMCC35007]